MKNLIPFLLLILLASCQPYVRFNVVEIKKTYFDGTVDTDTLTNVQNVVSDYRAGAENPVVEITQYDTDHHSFSKTNVHKLMSVETKVISGDGLPVSEENESWLESWARLETYRLGLGWIIFIVIVVGLIVAYIYELKHEKFF